MTKITTEQIYTSISCNRTPEIVDWNYDGIICCGASNSVVIYNTKRKGKDPLTILSHHKSQVKSVKWLHKPNKFCSELLSCSADKTAAIWTLENETWKVTSTLVGHSDGVTCVTGTYLNNSDLVVCTASIDSTIKIWNRINGATNLQQTIPLNSGLCLTLHIHFLGLVQNPILFCALDDNKVHMYTRSEEWHKVHVLVGHEDWIRGLDVLDTDNSSILLASASQDTYIRLWRIQPYIDQKSEHAIQMEQKVFLAYGLHWSVKLEAVLAGHEGWVYGVNWHPYSTDGETKVNKPVYRLLSSSLDKTLIVWEPEPSEQGGQEGAWVERVRVGEVGGNGLGFYGSHFGPNGASFLGHGYNGSLHIWTLNKEIRQWEPQVVCGGHFSSVEEVRWEPVRGRYIMSVSTDQTTRVHAPWNTVDGLMEWHEIARPQVHGYDMASLALVSSTTFASAAEEKVVRVFNAPHNFLQNFRNIVGEELVKESLNGQSDTGAEGASVPSLGLSNKAVFAGDECGPNAENENDGYFVPVVLTAPPVEEILMQNTLWPETQKLYGHGYEVFCVDAAPDGSLLASACKATMAEHAAVLIWETSTWHQLQKLVSHQLTVTQLAFSPDSQHLLSVSRDRRWTLYRRAQNSNLLSIVASTDKTNAVHSRIIWCCAWAWDGKMFGTGSRDGKICVWSKTDDKTNTSLSNYGLMGKPLEVVNASVTSVAFAPLVVDHARIIGAGFESGHIRVYSFTLDNGWDLLHELDNSAAHHLTVKRLSFCPRVENDGALLASCGADHLVRVYRLIINN